MKVNTYPHEFVRFLIEFHGTRDYFECHEILEEYWKTHDEDPLRDLWHGLIQVAVGLYHQRMGRRSGSIKMLKSAGRLLSAQQCQQMAIDHTQLIYMIEQRVVEIESNPSLLFQDFDLPITDNHLVEHCKMVCAEQNIEWGIASNLLDEALIFRHTLRNREDVIQARQQALITKREA
jgi:predicted metal-dependent hydrolase